MSVLDIHCHCGAIRQSVTTSSTDPIIPLTLCHCTTCRRTSGVLCTSYCPIETPVAQTLLARLTAYDSSPAVTRYFCRVCGCHVFRRSNNQWQVATGVIAQESGPAVLVYARHDHVQDTGDGGLALWLPAMEGLSTYSPPKTLSTTTSSLSASCHCGAVQFTVHHPDIDPVASRQPHSGYCDLLYPFATTDAAIVANPNNDKWWLTGPSSSSSTHYLAGTCACRTCRLTAGFEIQTWAFVPRANITWKSTDGQSRPLDFADKQGVASPTSPLSVYASSPGVERNFCSRCGATVFWHDAWRPDLVDVSAGLLIQPPDDHAARSESMLQWCTLRVSFAEECVRDRHGSTAQRAKDLIESLETGLKAAGTNTTSRH